MENIYMISDAEIINKISAKIKELRLKQNISRQDMATSSGVSVASIARMEDGEIKSLFIVLTTPTTKVVGFLGAKHITNS